MQVLWMKQLSGISFGLLKAIVIFPSLLACFWFLGVGFCSILCFITPFQGHKITRKHQQTLRRALKCSGDTFCNQFPLGNSDQHIAFSGVLSTCQRLKQDDCLTFPFFFVLFCFCLASLSFLLVLSSNVSHVGYLFFF